VEPYANLKLHDEWTSVQRREKDWSLKIPAGRVPAVQEILGIIAGSGNYPLELAQSARASGVKRIVAAAFDNETSPTIAELVDEVEWMRVGQLGRLLKFFQGRDVRDAVMAGQIAPRNLFDLRPDVRTLMLLAKLKRRNAESIFGAIADELSSSGITLLPATRFMERQLATEGLIAGPKPRPRQLEDLEYGFGIAKEISRLDIGQTVVVKNGTVLAVEGFEGTNEAIRRGGLLGKGEVVVAKVSKPNQDFRFDIPVVGQQTVITAREAGAVLIGVEAGKTLVLEREALERRAREAKISIYAKAL
jgi:DUF1009 family protein